MEWAVDTLVQGGGGNSSILVVVRPVRTLFKQYEIGTAIVELLRAASTDGIVVGVRAGIAADSGERATILAVLSSRNQLDALAAIPTSHGILTSVSEACSWFPNWSEYWTPKLANTMYTVRMVDVPRRLWIDGLADEDAHPRCQPFSIGDGPENSALAGLLVWFEDTYDPADPPFLILGSRRTVVAMSAALQTIFGLEVIVAESPPEREKTTMMVQRVIGGEPWVDAHSIEDLSDFAKMGDRYAAAAKRASR